MPFGPAFFAAADHTRRPASREREITPNRDASEPARAFPVIPSLSRDLTLPTAGRRDPSFVGMTGEEPG